LNQQEIKDYLEFVESLGALKVDGDKLKDYQDTQKSLQQAIQSFYDEASSKIKKSDAKKLSRKVEGFFVKSMYLPYALDPLSPAGSKYRDGRFHRKSIAETVKKFECFYLGANEHVVSAECLINPFEVKSPRVNVWVEVSLINVFDCTDLVRKFPFLDIVSREPWEGIATFTTPFTQLFGQFLASQDYSAIQYQSARMPDSQAKNLCVFPANISKGESILVMDPNKTYDELKDVDRDKLKIQP
jgi:hypothetical protein